MIPFPSGGEWEAAKAALSAIGEVAELIKRFKRPDTPIRFSIAIRDAGTNVHKRAIELCNELEDMHRNLAILRDQGYKVDGSLAEARASGWYWKISPFAPAKLLRNFRMRVSSVGMQADALFEDIVAVANCQEAEDQIANAIVQARERMRDLNDKAGLDVPMMQAVKDLLDKARELVKTTQDL